MGWESCLTMFDMVMREGNGHFYAEPVPHPSLLPTPVRGNRTPPHGTNEGGGQGGHLVFFAMGYLYSSGQEITCVFEPSGRPEDDQGTARHRTASNGWHRGSPSLI